MFRWKSDEKYFSNLIFFPRFFCFLFSISFQRPQLFRTNRIIKWVTSSIRFIVVFFAWNQRRFLGEKKKRKTFCEPSESKGEMSTSVVSATHKTKVISSSTISSTTTSSASATFTTKKKLQQIVSKWEATDRSTNAFFAAINFASQSTHHINNVISFILHSLLSPTLTTITRVPNSTSTNSSFHTHQIPISLIALITQ